LQDAGGAALALLGDLLLLLLLFPVLHRLSLRSFLAAALGCPLLFGGGGGVACDGGLEGARYLALLPPFGLWASAVSTLALAGDRVSYVATT
jgi:hypothetical protein